MRNVSVLIVVLTLVFGSSLVAQVAKEHIDLTPLVERTVAGARAQGLIPIPHTPCSAGSLSCGGTQSGRVSTDSCSADNIYAVGYSFNGTQGQTVTISGTSFQFAATVILVDGRGSAAILAQNDVFQLGQTARISNFSLPYTGPYIIFITPLTAVTFGDYTLSLTCGSAPPPTGSCSESSTTACMLSGRFRVSVRYRGAFDNNAPNTGALRKSVVGFANPAYETAFFYFNDSNNIEMMVKMLDQGNTNSGGQRTIAVLFGSATPLRIEVTITDTQTGATKTYNSFFNEMKGTTDFTAFVK